jgi:hypothetical protein
LFVNHTLGIRKIGARLGQESGGRRDATDR